MVTFTTKKISINFYLPSHNLYQYRFVGPTALSLLALLEPEGKTSNFVDPLISRFSCKEIGPETKNLSLWIKFKI